MKSETLHRPRGMRWLPIVALSVLVLIGAAATQSPVADAAMRGDVEAVRSLLQEGADVNAPQGDGMSALHWAAERGDGDIAAMLVYAGANVEAVTRIGQYTPLHIASRSGSARVVEILLQAGSDPDATTTTGAATPLHLAAAAGDADVVRLLLEHGAAVDAREAEWGQTPLIFAASRNRADALWVLLEHGADPSIPTRTLNVLEWRALDDAAADHQDEILESLVEEGKAPTPRQIQLAVLAGREFFLAGELPQSEEEEEDEDEDDQDRPAIDAKGGLTALLHAARQGHMEAARALLDGGADVDQFSAGDGTSPLLMAIINGQFDMAMMLIERGADPNQPARINEVAPLWAAVNTQWQPRTRFPQPQQHGFQQATYLDVMEALLQAGADPDHRTSMHPWYLVYSGCGNRNCGLADTEGSTAFWRAAYATDLDAMKLLVAHGADPNIPTAAPGPRRRRSFGPPPPPPPEVDIAGKDRPELWRPERKAEPQIDTYTGDRLDDEESDPSGLPPVPRGGPGVFPIHAAAGVGYGEGFAGNAHRHAPGSWLRVVRYLVEELGADVNARDHNGYNAVHHAAARGDNELILYLVEKGADVTAVSRRGQTTADMANGPVQRVSPFPDTVALLERLGSKNNHNCVSC